MGFFERTILTSGHLSRVLSSYLGKNTSFKGRTQHSIIDYEEHSDLQGRIQMVYNSGNAVDTLPLSTLALLVLLHLSVLHRTRNCGVEGIEVYAMGSTVVCD